MRVEIQAIQNNGTIVTTWAVTEKGRVIPIHWDHRQFQNFWESCGPLNCPFTGEYNETADGPAFTPDQ